MSQVDDEEARSEAVFDGVLQTLEQDYSHIGIPETLNALGALRQKYARFRQLSPIGRPLGAPREAGLCTGFLRAHLLRLRAIGAAPWRAGTPRRHPVAAPPAARAAQCSPRTKPWRLPFRSRSTVRFS